MFFISKIFHFNNLKNFSVFHIRSKLTLLRVTITQTLMITSLRLSILSFSGNQWKKREKEKRKKKNRNNKIYMVMYMRKLYICNR